jgi:hypothetical protein
MSLRYGHLLSSALPQLYERWRKAKELLAGRRERRASFVANKKRSPKLLFQQAHTRADRRLSDMQTVGSFNKAPCRDDLHKVLASSMSISHLA